MKQLERVLRTTEERLKEIAGEIEAAQVALAESAADEAGGDKKRASERSQAEKTIERLQRERTSLAAALPVLKERHEAAILLAQPKAEIILVDRLATHNAAAAAKREAVEASKRELARLEAEYRAMQDCDLSQRLGLVRSGDAAAILAALSD